MNAPTSKTGTAVAGIKVAIPSLQMNEEELITVMQNSIYPGAKIESIKLVLGYCRASGLDPMQKPVHIVPMSVKDGNEYKMRDVVMPGIGLYRVQASRTGQYGGVTEPVFGETKTLTVGDVIVEYPEWCRVSVKRITVSGQIVEFTANERWIENYATAGRNTTAPNAMWKRRPFAQLAKCAEAQALRKAFPELGAAPTADEMEGKPLDEGIVIEAERQQIADPQAKSAAAATDGGTKTPPKPPAKTDADSPQASAGMLNNIRMKFKALAAATEGDEGALMDDCFVAHEIKTLDGITVELGNRILAWIKQKQPS